LLRLSALSDYSDLNPVLPTTIVVASAMQQHQLLKAGFRIAHGAHCEHAAAYSLVRAATGDGVGVYMANRFAIYSCITDMFL
jgi:hypothetical protein